MMGTQSDRDAAAWAAPLRARLLAVARRRVPAEAAEDLVQETLRILLEKGFRGPGSEAMEGVPAMAFAFRVLRNVIGNHYQRDRIRRRRIAPQASGLAATDPAPGPLEALTDDEARRVVTRCLDALAASDEACARYLRRLIDGVAPAALARDEGLAAAVLYRRVYRCRLKLRALLEDRGFSA